MKHLATREDVSKLETRIIEKLDSQTKWLMGIVLVGLLTILAALVIAFF